KAFCDDPAHREECMKFAEEHGFAGKGREFGQERAMERRGFEIPPGRMPCASEEECRKMFEDNKNGFKEQSEEQRGQLDSKGTSRFEMERRSPQYEQKGRPDERHMPSQKDFRPGEMPRNMTPEQQRMFTQFQNTGTVPASSSFAPPPPSSPPPEPAIPAAGGTFQNSGSFSPPPASSQPPPPPAESAPSPSAQNRPSSFVASVFHIVDQLLR
ncbi:MAG: hypothetical protein AAB830_01160, partial [Patescibacteria group bacterium]